MPSADRAELRGETVLLVDNEPSIRRAGSRVLGRFGYRVLPAEDGRDAVLGGVVPKPYTPEEMLRAVRKALDSRG